MADVEQEFRDAMGAAGLHFDGPLIGDGAMHRVPVKGRRKGAQMAWYILHIDNFPVGEFGDFKTGVRQVWTAKNPTKMTPEERAAANRRVEESKRRQKEQEQAEHENGKAVAASVVAACEPATEAHPYVTRKGIKPFGAKVLTKTISYTVPGDVDETGKLIRKDIRKGSLVIPLYGPDKTLWTVQAIDDRGNKRFIKGSRVGGCYTSIGKLTDTIVICEGFATGASLHMATGLCCVIAVNAGNLKSVAKALRQKYPDRKFVIAADDDRFTDGNPGITKGTAAAEEIGARLVHPVFGAEDAAGTDFNDLHELHGLDAVRDQFAGMPAPSPANPPPAADEPPPHESVPDAPDEAVDSGGQDEPPRVPRTEMPGEGGPFPLGFSKAGDGVVYYYMGRNNGLIHALTPPQHTDAYFVAIAPTHYWEIEFPAPKGGADWGAARTAMIETCHAAGVYDPARVAGRGVFMDDGRVVVHLGDKLVVDNRRYDLQALPGSVYLYERGKKIVLQPCKPLDAEGGRRLIEAIGLLPWLTSDMAVMFAGMLFCAPICGALQWRPHAYVTGPRGSGKTWIINKVRQMLGDLCINFDGSSTEAAIRQNIGRDALPVIFDEAESQNEKSAERLQVVFDLARAASAEEGARISKGGQSGKAISYLIRSMFFFSSINKSATQSADESRIIEFNLIGAQEDETDEMRREREDHFEYIKRQFAALQTPDFGSRLFARALTHVRQIRDCAAAFASALSEKVERRVGDTYAVPLAGWWALTSDEVLTVDRAREVLESHGWALVAATRQKAEADHDKAVAHLLEQRIRVSAAREDTVAGLILRASEQGHAEEYIDKEAATALEMIGIKVVPGAPYQGFGEVYIGASHDGISRLFAKTEWAGTKWTGILRQHPGCVNTGRSRSFRGVKKKELLFAVNALVEADNG